MDSYQRWWFSIGLKALLVFAAGFAIWSVARRGVSKGREVVESASTISLPLPFVPFIVDGQRVGSLEGIEILRDAPKIVREVHLRAEAADSALLARLDEGCVLAADATVTGDQVHWDRAAFRCIADSAMAAEGLEPFGVVSVRGHEGDVALALPAGVVERLRMGDVPEPPAPPEPPGPPGAPSVPDAQAAAALEARAATLRAEIRAKVDQRFARP